MKLTDAAKSHLERKIKGSKKEMALTIGYDHCGCAGMQLSIGIGKVKEKGTPQIREEVDGFMVIYDLAARDLVQDALIDFDKRLYNYGFHLVDKSSSIL